MTLSTLTKDGKPLHEVKRASCEVDEFRCVFRGHSACRVNGSTLMCNDEGRNGVIFFTYEQYATLRLLSKI
jgi:hypothetical protein